MSIHFSHGNGFAASTYRYLFECLDHGELHYVDKFGHADYPVTLGLHRLADEMIADIRRHNRQPVVGMGHSAGGLVTILAACKQPELFSQLILLDPIMLSKRKRYAVKLFRQLGLAERFGPVKQAQERRDVFADREQARAYFAGKSLFKSFHPRCFDDYIEFGLKESERGVELAFSKSVEADILRHIGMTVPNNLKDLNGVVIYGKHSDVFVGADVRWWQRHFKQFKMVPFDGGHLFPFEQPEALAKVIKGYL